jgi:hypothetical protein
VGHESSKECPSSGVGGGAGSLLVTLGAPAAAVGSGVPDRASTVWRVLARVGGLGAVDFFGQDVGHHAAAQVRHVFLRERRAHAERDVVREVRRKDAAVKAV